MDDEKKQYIKEIHTFLEITTIINKSRDNLKGKGMMIIGEQKK